MPNYLTSQLVKTQTALAGEFASNDQRSRDNSIFKLLTGSANRFFPKYKELKKSVTMPNESHYFVRTANALQTSLPTHNHTGDRGDSATIDLNFSPYKQTFSQSLKLQNGKLFTDQEYFNDNMRNVILDFKNGLDVIAGDYLFNNKSGATLGTVQGKVDFSLTTDTYVIGAAFENEIATLMKITADLNKYQNTLLYAVCDSVMYSKVLPLMNQGAGNATNTSFQFGNIVFVHDASMYNRAVALDASFTNGYAVVMPANTAAVLDWIPLQNRQNVSTKENEYSNMINPADGLSYAVHSYMERADGVPVGGQNQDVLTQYETSIFLDFKHAPSSTADETPLMAFAIGA